MKTTNTFNKILEAVVTNKRNILIQSGMRCGKSVALMQLAFILCMNKPNYVICVICPSIRHCKTGNWRDAMNIIAEEKLESEVDINLSNFTISFKHTKSKIEMCAYMEIGEQYCRGRSQSVAWFSEMNVSSNYQIYQAVAGRTRDQIWGDYNPSGPKNNWIETKIATDVENTVKVKVNIDDNPFLTNEQKEQIYRMARVDETFASIYLKGEYANISELQIYTNWDIMPHDDFYKIFEKGSNYASGIDFGYAVSKSVLVECCLIGGELYVKEHIYETGLLNHEFADKILNANLHNRMRICADSAEIKTIDDINRYTNNNIHLQPAIKGKDSVVFGIQALKQVKIHVDSNSQHIIEDLSSYEWTRDKSSNEILQVPNKTAHDPHTLDALRYCYTAYYNNQSNSRTRVI